MARATAPAPSGTTQAPPPAAEAAPSPAAEAAPPPAASVPPPATSAADTDSGAEGWSFASLLPWLIAATLGALALLGFLAWRRRRTAGEEVYYQEDYYEPAVEGPEPAYADANGYQPQIVVPTRPTRPVAAAPRHEAEVTLARADRDDIAALAASSAPDGDRPWLEFLMRPVRAGTSGDDAVVEFELTVGNTGSAPAEDVRIATWMLGDAGSEQERSLIDPPARAETSGTRIEPGDGTRVDATVAVPREALAGDVLPVVVADVRYRLPDGGEGRTAARFAVGLPSGDGLAPFAVALGDGLTDEVGARLEGEPERV